MVKLQMNKKENVSQEVLSRVEEALNSFLNRLSEEARIDFIRTFQESYDPVQ